jgi:hypothetical protein
MSWEKVEKDLGRGPLGLLKWVAILVVTSAVLLGGLRACGLIGGAYVEHKVFKNSHQYKEGMAQKAANLQASIDEINIRLQQNPENAQELTNQKMFLSAQLRAVTINQ